MDYLVKRGSVDDGTQKLGQTDTYLRSLSSSQFSGPKTLDAAKRNTSHLAIQAKLEGLFSVVVTAKSLDTELLMTMLYVQYGSRMQSHARSPRKDCAAEGESVLIVDSTI